MHRSMQGSLSDGVRWDGFFADNGAPEFRVNRPAIFNKLQRNAASDSLRRHKHPRETRRSRSGRSWSAPILLTGKVIGVIEVSHKGETAESASPDFTPEHLANLADAPASHSGKLVAALRVARRKSRCNRRSQPRKRSEEHTSELQSPVHLVCRLLLEKKKKNKKQTYTNTKIRQ